MTLVCPNAGEILLLQYIVNMAGDRDPDHPVLHLYENDYTPVEGSTAGNFTEPDGTSGYDNITLTGGSWTTTLGGSVATAVYSEQTFTFTTGVDCYGYFVTDTSGSIQWAERFDGAPFELPAGGGTVAVSPKLTLE